MSIFVTLPSPVKNGLQLTKTNTRRDYYIRAKYIHIGKYKPQTNSHNTEALGHDNLNVNRNLFSELM